LLIILVYAHRGMINTIARAMEITGTGECKKPGELRSQSLLLIALSKVWVPFPEHVPKFIIENASADMQQEVGALLAPVHLLFFDHSLADHLVDGRFHKRCSDGFTISPTLALVC